MEKSLTVIGIGLLFSTLACGSSGIQREDVCAEIADAYCTKTFQICAVPGQALDCFQKKKEECCAGDCKKNLPSEINDRNICDCLTDIYKLDCQTINRLGYPISCGRVLSKPTK